MNASTEVLGCPGSSGKAVAWPESGAQRSGFAGVQLALIEPSAVRWARLGLAQEGPALTAWGLRAGPGTSLMPPCDEQQIN